MAGGGATIAVINKINALEKLNFISIGLMKVIPVESPQIMTELNKIAYEILENISRLLAATYQNMTKIEMLILNQHLKINFI